MISEEVQNHEIGGGVTEPGEAGGEHGRTSTLVKTFKPLLFVYLTSQARQVSTPSFLLFDQSMGPHEREGLDGHSCGSAKSGDEYASKISRISC